MCLSPHEMTAEELQERIDRMKAYLQNTDDINPYYKNMYEGRLEEYEKLLKEKADAGQMV
jgi:chromosome segregation ATPase